jgi:AraC family transcriptional regulator
MTTIATLAESAEHLPSGVVGWHRHAYANLALLKAGRYAEHALQRKHVVRHGLAVFNDAYSPHADVVDAAGATVVNVRFASHVMRAGVYALPAYACRPKWPKHVDEVLHALPDLQPLHDVVPLGWSGDAWCALTSSTTVTQAARTLGLSREHFQRRFVAQFGLTPQHALRESQLVRALCLLAGTLPLVEVAAEAGFSDQSHMTRLMRAATGLTPRAFRQRCITTVQDAAITSI